jgi:hypothetical protein
MMWSVPVLASHAAHSSQHVWLLLQVNALGAGLLLGSALVIILPEGMLLDHKHSLS